MKLLQITKKFPFPIKDGESVAVNNLARALNELDWDLDLLTMNTSKHPVAIGEINGELKHYRQVFHQKVDNHVTWFGALLHLLKGRSYQADRFVNHKFQNQLIEVLIKNEYDVIQLESPYLSPYIETIRKHSDAHISMRAHNVEHVIWKRLAKHTPWGFKKWYFQRVAKELEGLEKSYFPHYDSLVAISDYDADTFKDLGFKGNITSVPIGLDMNHYSLSRQDNDSPSICFIGTLDWRPNVQGLEWFLKEAWPKVVKIDANTPLHIAGRGAEPHFIKLAHQATNCHFEGEVPFSNEFLQQHTIMVVPLLSGSGIRVKIIEGMAKGMLVITTSCGLEGIPARHMHNVIVADSAEKFSTMLLYAIQNPADTAVIRENARKFASQFYDMHAQGKQLDRFYRQNISASTEKPEPIITFEPKL